MSIKRILTFNNEEDKKILMTKSEPVETIDDEIQNIIQDMKDTLIETKNGIGLSAIQIGISKRICVIKYNGIFYTIINPIVTRVRGKMFSHEGCLSVPRNLYRYRT